MNATEFDKLAASGYTRIPLMRTVLADLDTPVSAYRKLAAGPYSYLFESVQGGEKWGRYSILGLPARCVIEVRGRVVRFLRDGVVQSEETVADPLAWIEQYRKQQRIAPREGLPAFIGGLVGYFGYDTVRYIEPKLADGMSKEDPLGTPDILLMVSEEVLVFDNLSNRLHLIVLADPAQAEAYAEGKARLDALEKKLSAGLPESAAHVAREVVEDDFVSGFSEQGFLSAVARIKEYVAAGDVMQVVLAQRMQIAYQAPPLDLYRALRSLNPSPYMFFLDLGDFHVVGSSPEILTRVEDGVVTVRPIAGTRRRGKDLAEDLALEAELLADPKERAEHLMLIDLGRNDVGRVAQTGTVQVTEEMRIERYSHVMHIVSNVEGQLKPDLCAMDVLRATFPAGTVSGAPKIRAMEIIDELEPVKRGVYAGAVGYLSWNGNLDTAIAIRTAVIKDGMLSIQAGAGVVHDSVPRLEWKETMNKGRAVFRAVAMAEAGLNG
jgi:anthranilate synthase component 1